MQPWEVDNGILAKVGGDYIGMGGDELPEAETCSAQQMKVEMVAGWVGRVRVTYERRRFKHYKTIRWAWIAKHAELAPEHEDGAVVVTTQPEPVRWHSSPPRGE